MNVLNESLQWATLIVVSGAVLGLYRQLANFMIPRREQVALAGPDVGARLPRQLLGEAWETYASHVRGNVSGLGLVGVLSQHCPGCQDAVRVLRTDGAVLGGLSRALICDSHASPEFVDELTPLADVVIEDPHFARSHEVGIRGWPFFLVVDGDMRVVSRAITSDILSLVNDVRDKSSTRVADEIEIGGLAHVE